jgi:hypothetical protein
LGRIGGTPASRAGKRAFRSSLASDLQENCIMTIKRVWHGWTTKENTERYQTILKDQVLPGIESKNIPGYQKIEVLRIERDSEVEFVTIMTFASLRNVINFQGENYKRCYVPAAAQQVLKRWDPESSHYEVIETRTYQE